MRLLQRLLLMAFPKSFRERHGRDLVQALLTDCRTKTGRLSALRVLAASPDLVRAGLAERFVAILVPAGDVRLALRRWRRRPGFAITAILTLALGIGATTSIFSVVDAVILRPLPWPDADRLVVIHGVYPDRRQSPAYATTWNRGMLTCPAGILALATLAAIADPIRRASRLDPVQSLKE